MPKRTQKRWAYNPPKPTLPESLKSELSDTAQDLVEQHLKGKFIQPPPKDQQFNYLVDIWTKWYRDYFYFCGTYASPGPNAISPTFEVRFARMKYAGNKVFNLAFMRHTGQWVEIYEAQTIEACLESIRDDPYFFP